MNWKTIVLGLSTVVATVGLRAEGEEVQAQTETNQEISTGETAEKDCDSCNNG